MYYNCINDILCCKLATAVRILSYVVGLVISGEGIVALELLSCTPSERHFIAPLFITEPNLPCETRARVGWFLSCYKSCNRMLYLQAISATVQYFRLLIVLDLNPLECEEIKGCRDVQLTSKLFDRLEYELVM